MVFARELGQAKARACVRLAVTLLCHCSIPVKCVLVIIFSRVEKAV